MFAVLLFLAVASRLFAFIMSDQSVDKSTEKGDKAMTLGDYLELRKRGWNNSAVEVEQLPKQLERYRAKVSEIQSIIESLDKKTLDMEITLRGR